MNKKIIYSYFIIIFSLIVIAIPAIVFAEDSYPTENKIEEIFDLKLENKPSLISISSNEFDMEQYWIDEQSNVMSSDIDTFKVGKTYTYYLKLIPKTGYYFAKNSLTIVGVDWESSNIEEKSGVLIFTGIYMHKNDSMSKVVPSVSSDSNSYNNTAGIKNGWITENGNRYYYINGVMARGVTQIGSDYYFFGENSGKLFTTPVTALNGTVYYPEPDGKLITDWKTINNERYYYIQGVMARGVTKIGNDYYFFGENSGKLFTTPVTALNGTVYIPEPDGKLITDWKTINNERYYYIQGVMTRGVTQIGNDYYFFGENSGKLFTTPVTALNGTVYIPESDGRLTTGWKTLGNDKYYTKDGIMQKGIIQIGNDKYFLGENSGKLFTTPVTALNGTVYYPDSDGKLSANWKIIDNNKYYISQDGTMAKGVTQIGSDYYFFGENSGKLFTTQVTSLNGTIYLPDTDGKLTTGWKIIDNDKYYTKDGIMQRGITQIGSDYYFFGENSGKLFTEIVFTLNGTGYVPEPDGRLTSGWKTVGTDKYYTYEKGIMARGITQIGSDYYFFGENTGRLIIGFVHTLNGDVYYMDQDGKVQMNQKLNIQGNWYNFGPDGKLVNGWQYDNANKKQSYIYADGTRAVGMKKIGGYRYLFSNTGVLLIDHPVQLWIDISAHQGVIDWDALWASGDIDGVIIKMGSGSSSGAREDSQYKRNLEAVKRLNIPYSLYYFSYAENTTEAYNEAVAMANLFRKYGGSSPNTKVYYDIEYYSYMDQNTFQAIIETFGTRAREDGIPNTSVYASKNFGENKFNSTTKGYMDWVAHYTGDPIYLPGAANPVWSSLPKRVTDFSGNWKMWQYSDYGFVTGINGNVDLNVVR